MIQKKISLYPPPSPTQGLLSTRRRFQVIPLGSVDAVAVRVAAANLQAIFDIPTDVKDPWPDPVETLFPGKDQYNATRIIDQLAENTDPSTGTIGITAGDISLPFFTYLFGLAQVGGRVAVISTFRLHGRKKGVMPPLSLIYNRLAKITIHETGHLLGLSHCRHPRCIMNFSVGLTRLDDLSAKFCGRCLTQLAA